MDVRSIITNFEIKNLFKNYKNIGEDEMIDFPNDSKLKFDLKKYNGKYDNYKIVDSANVKGNNTCFLIYNSITKDYDILFYHKRLNQYDIFYNIIEHNISYVVSLFNCDEIGWIIKEILTFFRINNFIAFYRNKNTHDLIFDFSYNQTEQFLSYKSLRYVEKLHVQTNVSILVFLITVSNYKIANKEDYQKEYHHYVQIFFKSFNDSVKRLTNFMNIIQ